MQYKLLVSDEAELDIYEAFYWYELQRKGLGKEFELCLDAAMYLLTRNPLICQLKYKETRVKYIKRFPYSIHYRIENDKIDIIAVFHSSRNPTSWSKRLA